MPKSRRERKSALSQVKKKGRALKDALVTRIREAVETYPNIYIFEVEHMKNSVMKQVREDWTGSKFFLGKNKVMQLALGRTPEEEQKSGLAKLSQLVSGSRGLLFTSKPESEVLSYFQSFRSPHYARSGTTCPRAYKLAAGTLPATKCPHPMEPMLRKLGLPTRLIQGKVELLNDVEVTRKGDALTPEQCKILQIFGVRVANFRIQILHQWNAENGSIKDYEVEEEDGAEGEDEEDGDEAIELRTAGDDDEAFDGTFDEDGESAALMDDDGEGEAMQGGDGEGDEEM